MKDSTLSQVGKKIKEIRKGKNMSLQEVASKSDVTAGLVSKIENFRTIPSLPVLLNISRALEVNMAELVSNVDDENTSYVLIKKGEAEVEERDDSKGLLYQALVSKDIGSLNFRSNIVTVEPSIYRKPISTDGLELIYVVAGEVVYGLNGKEISLSAGDTFFFDGSVPHSVENKGTIDAIMFKVYLLKR